MLMALALIVLALPVVLGSLRVARQLAINSRVYDRNLTGSYSAGGGLEVALWQLTRDPNFDVGLTPAGPSRTFVVQANGQDVNVTVTKIFSSNPLTGQGLRITKTVTPTSAAASTPTTYTYTVDITNVGTGDAVVKRIRDLLPNGFSYVSGSTSGVTTANPDVDTESLTPDGSTLWPSAAGGNPLPWATVRGSASLQGTLTPAQSTWTLLPEYWEFVPVAGQFAGGEWEHNQWWWTGRDDNQWRWLLQRVRGETVTTLFTSSAGTLKNEWKRKKVGYEASSVPLLAGDILRLRMEVYSIRSSAAEREFRYRWGGTMSYDSWTQVPGFTQANCGTSADELRWDITLGTTVTPGQSVTLTFQAAASRPDGTYYNQAWVRYIPWWDTANQVEQHTPPTAPVSVGTGQPECAAGILVSKTVTPLDAPVGVETTFTYSINIQNTSPFAVPIKKVYDLLPPSFTFVPGSTTGFWPNPPNELTLDVATGRWRVMWNPNGNASVAAGATATQTFQALATPSQGMSFHNDAWVEWDGDSCVGCAPGDNASFTGSTATILMPKLYDVQATAPSGAVLARVQLSQVGTQVTVLSFQGG